MELWLLIPSSLVAGYLIGSISFAVLLARMRGVDIFTIGSGNPGATNVMRACGKPFGYACFLLDAFKGIAAVLVAAGLAGESGEGASLAGIVALLGAILGHSYSVFLGFRGGKGVATTVGGLLALLPWVMVTGAVVWLVVFFLSRYVSLASIALGLSLPVSSFFLYPDPRVLIFCSFLCVLIILRHRSNIQRLLAGTENRAGPRKS